MLGTIMQSFMILSVVSILWILFGYSLAFGPDKGGVIGGLDRVERGRCGAPPDVWADDSSLGLHAVPTDVCGAHCRRGSDLVRCCCFQPYGRSWSMCHWHIGFGGGGWLAKMGAVVHISSGLSALVCALVLGKRRGYGTDYMAPHNLPMTMLGAGLLWFGCQWSCRVGDADDASTLGSMSRRRAEHPSVAHTASCRCSWPPPGEKPKDCQNCLSSFKSTPLVIAASSAPVLGFQIMGLVVTGHH